MHSSKDEVQARLDFARRYSLGTAEILLEIESEIIGGRWGANGYTTVDQADLLGRLLQLAPGELLLDIGSGQGWPGLYLAQTTGCDVVLTDLPIEGLTIASERSRTDAISSLGAVVSSGRRLPFADGVFDAICHTDVLC